MTYEIIIIGIGVLIGLSLFKKTNPIFIKGILVGLVVTFVLTFFGQQLLTDISFFSFGILTLIFTVYSGMNKKWLNLIVGLFAFVSFFFILMNYPFANELKLLMIIPIFCYLLIFRNWKKYNNELSILTILVAYELTEFLRLAEQWIN